MMAFALFYSLQCCQPPQHVTTHRGGVLNGLHDSKVVVKSSQNVHIYIYQDSILIDTIPQ